MVGRYYNRVIDRVEFIMNRFFIITFVALGLLVFLSLYMLVVVL